MEGRGEDITNKEGRKEGTDNIRDDLKEYNMTMEGRGEDITNKMLNMPKVRR